MTENNEISQQTPAAEAPAEAPKVTELDGLSEFSFGGEKYTPDRFQEILSQYKTYSDQFKEISEQKKFEENLETDLDNVLQNPHLAQRFKEIYPKKFHGILDRMLKTGQATAQGQQASQPQQAQLPKEILQSLDDVKFLKDHVFQTKVEAANAKLDAMLPPLFKKYSLANEEQVYAKAEAVLAKGQSLSDAAWERLVRESHEAISKKADAYYGEKLKSQLEKGKQGKDVGPGGVTPGQAPKKAKNFDQAYEEMLKSVQTR
jgi:hypothetical protein